MPLLVRNLTLGLEEPEAQLLQAVAERLQVPTSAIRAYAPVRRSMDARHRGSIHFVYHVEVALDESIEQEHARAARLANNDVVPLMSDRRVDPIPGNEPFNARPIIVGFGPAGMFAALRLVRFGHKPIILERGVDVRRRHRDILQTFYRDRIFNAQSNLLFGEGGAGTYSDGKLYTRINDPLVRTVLEWLYLHGADPDILTDARPHIGSDRLPTVCRNIRRHLEREGAEIRFESQLHNVDIDGDRITSVEINGRRETAGPVILAIGHSARDTLRMLHDAGVHIEARPFQIGVRIEHPQAMVDAWQYGQKAGHDRLPPAEYHVVAKGAADGGRDCYSFCMCPGGVLLPTNEDHGLIATNGASKSKRGARFANTGLVISFPALARPGNPLAGIDFQRQWEEKAYLATGGSYRVPAQRAVDFLAGRTSAGKLETSYPLGGQWTDIRSIIPTEVSQAIQKALPMLDSKMPGFAGGDALITAPETRVSAPVRLPRHRDRRTAKGIHNLYPAGEGAGYAGGIISAAIDGIKSADALIRRYAPA